MGWKPETYGINNRLDSMNHKHNERRLEALDIKALDYADMTLDTDPMTDRGKLLSLRSTHFFVYQLVDKMNYLIKFLPNGQN